MENNRDIDSGDNGSDNSDNGGTSDPISENQPPVSFGDKNGNLGWYN